MLPADSDPRRPGTLWVMHLDWPTPGGLTPQVPATFSQIGPEAAGPLARAMGHRDPAVVLERLATGRRCYAACIDGKIAAYGWVTLDEEWIGEIRLRIRLVAGEAYVWDCATLPAYRRRRLYTALLAHITSELRAAGLCRVWIGADIDNVASQNGIALAGFKPVADLVVDRVLTLRQVWVRGRHDIPEYLVADVRRAVLGDRDRVWLAALANQDAS